MLVWEEASVPFLVGYKPQIDRSHTPMKAGIEAPCGLVIGRKAISGGYKERPVRGV